VAVAVAALAVSLSAACGSGGDPGGTPRNEDRPIGGVGKGPEYKRAAIPGLANKPVWSLSGRQVESAVPLGDVVAVVGNGEPADGQRRSTIRLLEPATGAVRATIDATSASPAGAASGSGAGNGQSTDVGAARWRDGSPALVVRTLSRTEGDGLHRGAERTTVTMYSASGHVLGKSEFDGDVHRAPVVRDGYIVVKDSSGSRRRLIPIGGGPTIETPRDATWDVGPVDNRTAPPLKYRFFEPDEPGKPWRLVVADMFDGRRLWGTDTIPVPEPLRGAVTPRQPAKATVLAVRGDRVVFQWTTVNGPTTFTAHDLATGRLISQGPTTAPGDDPVTGGNARVAVSPDGKTAVIEMERGTLAWNTDTGAPLWERAPGERQLSPLVISPSGVLFAELDRGPTVAVDLRTHTLLSDDVPAAPAFTDNGYGILTDSSTGDVFVFPPG
jgi:hypothetical protein